MGLSSADALLPLTKGAHHREDLCPRQIRQKAATLSATRKSAVGLPIVVMGVTGSGKTTLGLRLAAALTGEFVDGDDLHTDAAREKMRSGIPLVDDDRWPWLDRIGARLKESERSGAPVIIACSALKKVYRDRLRAAVGPRLRFVYLEATREAMRARVAARKGHYMPASLVDSQFAALEPPVGEGDVLPMAADADLDAAVAALVERLSALRGP